RDGAALATPAWRPHEPGGQPLVVRAESFLQCQPYRLGHRRAGPDVARGERGLAEVRQAEELENPIIVRPRVGEKVATVDDVNLLAAEDALEAFQLAGIVAAGTVGIQPERPALVSRVGGQWVGLGVTAHIPHVEP